MGQLVRGTLQPQARNGVQTQILLEGFDTGPDEDEVALPRLVHDAVVEFLLFDLLVDGAEHVVEVGKVFAVFEGVRAG